MPDLIYVDDDLGLAAVAPRCVRFHARGRPQSFFLKPAFDECFGPPELAFDTPVPETDSFMIAATVFYLSQARLPFKGSNSGARIDAMEVGDIHDYSGDPVLGDVLRRALAFNEPDRASLEELAAALAGS